MSAAAATPAAARAEVPAHRPARTWLAIAAVALAASLLLATAFPLLDPDEGRNAEVAREMLAGGDWLVPHLAGMAYLDKPPALFWAEAGVMRVAGRNRWAARVPAALAACALLLVFGALAARRRGGAFARRLVALTAAAPLFAVLSAYAIFDMLLALCVAVVIAGIAEELASGPSTARRTAMFLAIAAGILVKGPVMLAWVLGGALATALLARSRAPLAWLKWWPGWMLALAIPGAWFALASQRYPEYPHYAFLEESFERMSTGHFHRQQGWWFVPAVLAGGALPWSLLTPWRALRLRDDTARAMLGFVVFATVFFTLSQSKLVTYLVPALPPLAWLAAEAWSAHAGRLRWWMALSFTPLALLAGGPWLLRYAASQSGETLAAAIRARAPHAQVVFADTWSPGTDFALGRASTLAAADARVTTSTYQQRYRGTLASRGLWTLAPPLPAPTAPPARESGAAVAPAARDSGAAAVSAARDTMLVLVTPARAPAPGTGEVIFLDGRFRATVVRASSIPPAARPPRRE